MFNPNDEPCGSCGRELEECVCDLVDLDDILDEEGTDWGTMADFKEELDNDE